MPTINELVEEVRVLAHGLSEQVSEADKEQKARHEELTSKTTAICAEHKTVTDRFNARINELNDQIEKLITEKRLAEQRPPLHGLEFTGKSDHHRAFFKAVRNYGKIDHRMSPEERSWIVYDEMPTERKALYANDPTSGGFFAPSEFVAQLIEYRTLVSKMRGICQTQATDAPSVDMPSLATDTTAYWATEQTTVADSTDPSVAMIRIPVHEMRGYLKVSKQNLEDAKFDLEGFIKKRLGIAFAKKEGAGFINGTGNGQPRGIMSYPKKASSSYSGGSAGKNNVTDAVPYIVSGQAANITADNILNVKMDLKSDYDANATYIFTRGTLNSIRLLKNSFNEPLWMPFASAQLPGTIYGSNYVEMPDMPEIGAGTYPIAVGDFSNYLIVDRLTMDFQQLNELLALSSLIGFIARMRVGGDLLVPESLRLLKCSV